MKAALAFVLVLCCASAAQASDALKSVMDSYLKIQSSLAADKIDGVKDNAAAIATAAAPLGEKGAAIVKAAKSLETATDLKSARQHFGALSAGVIDAAKAENFKDVPGVKVAYCPMVNASWLQKEEQIRNPYYGSGMLTCGEFKK
jgi:hypothetical protein